MSESWTSGKLTVTRISHGRIALAWAGGSTGTLTLTRSTAWVDGSTESTAVAGAVDVPGATTDLWIDGEAPFGRGVRSITYSMGVTSVTIPPAEMLHVVISDPISGVSVPAVGGEADGLEWESETEASWLHVQAGGYPLVHARPEQAPTERLAVYTTTRVDSETLAELCSARRPLLLRAANAGVPDRWFTIVGARQEQRLHRKMVDEQWRLHSWQVYTLPRPNPATSARHVSGTLGQLDVFMRGDVSRSSWGPSASSTVRVSTSRYEAFPRAARLADGTVLAVWSSQTDHFQKNGPSYGLIMQSTDDVAWSSPRRFASSAVTPTAIATLGSRAAMLLRGEGKTWSVVSSTPTGAWPTPTEIPRAQWGTTSWVFPSDLIWLDNGTTDGLMLATCYSGDGLHVTASTDAGRTWAPRPQPFPATFGSSSGPAEPCLSMTADGRLLMLIRWDRRFSGSTVTEGDIWACWSSDQGQSWTAPVVVIPKLTGQPAVTLMPDGALLATLRDATFDGSVNSWVLGESRDHGLTWHTTDFSSGMMMYGNVVATGADTGLLVGSDQTSESTAVVWAMPLSVSQRASSDLAGTHARFPGSLAEIAAADLTLDGLA